MQNSIATYAAMFLAIFMAEMADKTQLATMSYALSGSSRIWTFVTASAALVTSTAIAVFAADLIVQHVSMAYVSRIAAVLLIGTGVWMLFRG